MRHLRRERIILNCFNIYILSVLIDTCYNSIWAYLPPQTAQFTQDTIMVIGLMVVMIAACICLKKAILDAHDVEAMRLSQNFCVSSCTLLAVAGIKSWLDI